ncbi:MAG: MFS transporter [Clostridiales Family XIII bacterium]|jgi:predicted MFS family arabinose efflux permease|nr:MFS transporter [Clostridiales Family XIII bacterium]
MKKTRGDAPAKPKLWTKDYIVLCAVNVLFSYGFSMMMPLLALYIVACGGDSKDVGITSAGFTMAAILMRFVSPLILDKMNRKLLLALCTAISAGISLGYTFTDTVAGILLYRILMGFAFGIVSALCTTLAADILPDLRRGEGIGYFGMGNTLMSALSPVAALYLAEHTGYPAAFVTACVGQLLCTVAVGFFRPPREVIAPRPQKHAKAPPFVSRVFDKALLLHMILLVLFGLYRSSELNFLPLLAVEKGIKNFPVFYFCQTGVSFLTRMVIGSLYDRKGAAYVMIPGGVMALIGIYLFSISNSLDVLLLAGAFNGMMLGAVQPGLQAWAIDCVAPERRSIASAAYFSYYDIGLGIGAFIMGYMARGNGYSLIYTLALIPAALFLAVFLIGFFGLKMGRPRGAHSFR